MATLSPAALAPLPHDPTLPSLVARFQSAQTSDSFADGPASNKNKSSAVLVGLFTHPVTRAIHVLLTQRSAALRSHAGDVALPGGKRDESDGSDAVCALREAEEEIGLPRELLVPFSADTTAAAAAAVAAHSSAAVSAHAASATAASDDGSGWTLAPGIHLLAHGAMAVSKDNLPVRPVMAAVPAPSFLIDAAGPAAHAPLGSFTPSLNSTEVACLFSLPLHLFLTKDREAYGFKDIVWRGNQMRIHEFRVTLRHGEYIESEGERDRRLAALQDSDAEAAAPQLDGAVVARTEASTELPPREFRVWGLTAYMVIRAATLLLQREPLFDAAMYRVAAPTGSNSKVTAAEAAGTSSKL